MNTITINRVLVEPANYLTNEERKENERRAAAATFKALYPPGPKDVTPKEVMVAAVHLPAEKVTGTCKLHVDPATSGAPEVPVDRPDLLGHVIKNGVCTNPGCNWQVSNMSFLLGLSDDERAVALAIIREQRRRDVEASHPADLELVKPEGDTFNEQRCVGEKRPAFVPRVVTFCPECTLAMGDGCLCVRQVSS